MSATNHNSNYTNADNEEVCDRLLKSTESENVCKNENEVPTNKTSRKVIVQIMLSVFLILAAASTGMIMGYSAVLLPQLKAINGSLHIDDDMGSWIASITTAATPVGSILSGVIIDYCGRKPTLGIQMVVIIIGWLIIMFAESHTVLLIGRFFGGIATGLGVVAGQVYVAEISDPRMRGVFSSIPFSSMALGILLVYGFGSIMHWRLIAGLSIIIPAISAILIFFFPESPVWLVRQGHVERARKACLWFRGNNDVQAEEEVQQLISRVENEKLQTQQNPQSAWRTFCTRQVLKPFLITNILNFLQALSGVYLIVFYAVDIISQIGVININDFLAAVLTAAVRLIFTVIACCLLAVIGRRTIGLYSGLGTAISAAVLGTSLYYSDSTNGYFLAICLLVYVAANTLGLLILPGIMIGELFPAKARGLAGSATYTIFSIFTFGITKLFPVLKQSLNIHGMFWLFSISSFLASVLIYLTLPETKGKTLNDIEDYFSQDNIFWITRNRNSNSYKNNEAHT